jgi:anti-anti-sigma regulatory factor
MLRINIIDTADEVRFILYGRLTEPWISELQAIMLEKEKTRGNRKIVMNLRETTSIDEKGIEFLSTMSKNGVRLLTSGVLMRYLLEDFRKRTKQKTFIRKKNIKRS